MYRDIERVLIDRERIARRVRELGGQIASDLQGELDREGALPDASGRIVMIPVLTGSIIFVADLMRQMPLKISLGVVAVSSYPGRATSSQGATIEHELPDDLEGKHVLVVDDILDSGRTMALIRDRILAQKPASLRLCVLLDKEAARASDVQVDYAGFRIPNEFVVGYGLDYDGHYRNYPEIGVLRLEAIEAGSNGG